MKLNGELDSDNNNNADQKVGKRGRPRKIDLEAHKTSKEACSSITSDAGDVGTSPGAIITPPPSLFRKMPTSSTKRILKNLQSTLSPNYLGSPSSVFNEIETVARVTRNRRNILDSSMEPVMTDDESTASQATEKLLDKGVSQETVVSGENNKKSLDDKETSLVRNNGFEADAEDADIQDERMQVKRKQKRGRRFRKASDVQKEKSAAEAFVKGVVEDSVQQSVAKIETMGNDETTEQIALTTKPVADNIGLKKATSESQDRLTEVTETELNIDLSTTDLTKDLPEPQTESLKIKVEKLKKKASLDDSLVVSLDAIKTEPEESTNELEQSPNLTIENAKSSVLVGKQSETQINSEKNLSKIPINTYKKNVDPNVNSSASSVQVKSDPETSLNSPSSVSIDSAKGSSIVTDSGWPTYQTGDLYWGKLYTYCYWPCMVCPDPHGQIVGNAPAQARRPADSMSIQVHVRFFADNGRRNWIRHENLMQFVGLKSFEDHREEIRIKFGMKSTKFRQMVPKKSKLSIWHEAVNEANLVAELPFNERLEKFFEIYENSITFQKQQRKRRSSMLQAGSTSDIGSSIYDSTDKLYAKQTISVPKRERSASPYSPAFSPVKGANFIPKRRKLTSEEEIISETANANPLQLQEKDVDLNEVSNFITQQESGLYRNKEFMELFLALKEFVIRRDKNEQMERCLLSIANNIWSLLLLNIRQKESQRSKTSNDNETGSSESVLGDKSVKRLSSRLKNINIRRSQTPVVMPALMTVSKEPERRASETSKPKKVLNRPIDEVIEDILKLDKRYLFRGLGRDPVCKYCHQPGTNLKRCSKGCNSWLHLNCSINKDPIEKQEIASVETAIETVKSDVETTETESNDSSPLPSIPGEIQKSIVATIHITAEGETHEDEPIVCSECTSNASETCCICHQEKVKNTSPPTSPIKSPFKTQIDSDKLVSCNMQLCTKKFHPMCCKYWPQAKISKSTVRCPSHVCHTCVSDDPSGKFQQLGNAKLTKCVKCPATYHMDSSCIPAGSKILTASHIICPRHTTTKSDMHVNVAWCYICVKGGELICCETCPIAVHAHCRNIPIKPNENYICEECESGRLPLYGEIVWAKFNNFRWWPAIILPPTEVPANIARMLHGPSDFVVRFFGTHDHAWISRRRVYLYIEGDDGEAPKTKSQLDQNYVNGVAEASRFLRIIKARRQEQAIATANGSKLHPQPYIKIKTNKPVLPVKLHIDLEKVNKCECNPDAENPCGPDSECLNRVLFNECNPKVCRAGQRCLNQMFETRISPRLEVVYMNERGFGLICRESITEGSFIVEYVGEIINDAEFRQRMAQKTRDRDENFYFLVVEKDYIIDAGPKGNLARFMNHSCEPNCETQKWSVNGINRIGLFAIKDIPENTELTFNYHWDDLLNNQKKVCFCGAPKCAGEIGGKYKEGSPKDFLSQPSKTKAKSNASIKSKKFKELKRLQIKKKTAFKIEILAKKSTVKAKKHVSADDIIETEN